MMTRFIHALVTALTCLVLAISPVAGMADSERAACAEQVVLGPAHHHVGHEAMAPEPDTGKNPFFICCDHGCLFDVTVAGLARRAAFDVISVPNNWDASGYSDLTDPLGLRRPPRV
ncbi:hypothetical protein [Tropicibacter sp. S64]|uniref:hypothetical protein n=1 Tax=Tropicibacter sp. S64 TaxID=3415122 RepID=UPI003C7ED2CB